MTTRFHIHSYGLLSLDSILMDLYWKVLTTCGIGLIEWCNAGYPVQVLRANSHFWGHGSTTISKTRKTSLKSPSSSPSLASLAPKETSFSTQSTQPYTRPPVLEARRSAGCFGSYCLKAWTLSAMDTRSFWATAPLPSLWFLTSLKSSTTLGRCMPGLKTLTSWRELRIFEILNPRMWTRSMKREINIIN